MKATFKGLVSLLHKDGKKENKGVRAKKHSPRTRKMMAQERNTDKVQIKVKRKKLRLRKHKINKYGPRKDDNNNRRRAERMTRLRVRGSTIVAGKRALGPGLQVKEECLLHL